MKKEIIYPGNLHFSDLQKQKANYLYEMQTSSWSKNPIFILFDPKNIDGYDKADVTESMAFENILKHPKFCVAKGKPGIKKIKKNIPRCEVKINGNDYKTNLTIEMKIKGKAKDARIAMYELNPTQGDGPTLYVASHFIKNGFHKDSECKKKYHTELNINQPILYSKNSAGFFHNHRTTVKCFDSSNRSISLNRGI